MSSIRARLSVVVGEGEEEQRFITPNNEFNSGDVVISSSGLVQVRGSSTLKDHFNPKELQILEVIGSGACSTVRKAVYQGTTVVALKQINIFNSIGHRNQLVEEIKSLYKTDCAAIVKFYGAYLQDNNHIAIVLEYLDGGSLGNVLDQVGPVPEGAIANIAFQVLWGLAYMKHERRLHRDIKPQNILINSLGQVKLTDFGVSKELMNTVAMGKTYVGTFKYMAPERLMNQPHNFASDIYSLGIVLYELAVGRTPFADLGEESQINVCQIAVSEVIPTLPEGRFSPHFRDFVSRCISKQPGDRPAPEKLLGHPWLAQHAANSLGEATQNVRQWIASLQ